ncbi:hypothetical protein K458DRAFT_404240 [Lentithecium fluviatile CBS 122367]|uniref:Uncharacterized protein n=1 Tax=Lentithecium fluviatile CBS 122367 TaxID=1168545 RepID=A0A6G1J108_9PLEO|nr:hypothetical protein K458DRAFT_404240 [Lentithecium fluviatile CBS 122367]
MELCPSRERRLPKRYRGDGTWGNASPPSTPDKPCPPDGPAHKTTPDFERATLLGTPPGDLQSLPDSTRLSSSRIEAPQIVHATKARERKSSAASRLRVKAQLWNDDMATMKATKKNLARDDDQGTVLGVTAASTKYTVEQRYELKLLTEDRESKDEEKRRSSLELVRSLWECEAFPEDMDGREREWHRDVIFLVAEVTTDECISFLSLYPSLRQTIIDSITNTTDTMDIYQSAFHPVYVLLHLDAHTIQSIIDENGDFCPTGDEPHFQKWKREHPGEPLDPDLPPPEEMIKAIRYLRQECLPGSLLGEWQFSLPEVFETDDESELPESAIDFMSAQIDEVEEDMGETTDSEHGYDSLIVMLHIQSKSLARMGKWGTQTIPPLPAHEGKPRPSPSTSINPVELAQESKPTEGTSFDHNQTRDTQSTEAIEVEAQPRAGALFMSTAPIPTLGPQSSSRIPLPRLLSHASTLGKRPRSSLDFSEDTEELEHPAKLTKKNPPPTRNPTPNLPRSSKIHKKAYQNANPRFETELASKYASLLESMPNDDIINPPIQSQQMDPNEPIIIDDSDENEESIAPIMVLKDSMQHVTQPGNGTTQPASSRACAPIEKIPQPNDSAEERKRKNLEMFEQMTEDLFGGLNPSSVAKMKWSDSTTPTPIDVTKRFIPLLNSNTTVLADKTGYTNTFRPSSQKDGTSYTNKKPRLEGPHKAQNAYQERLTQGRQGAQHTSMAPPPSYTSQRKALRKSSQTQARSRSSQNNLQYQLAMNDVWEKTKCSGATIPIGLPQQYPVSKLSDTAQYNRKSHKTLQRSFVPQQAGAWLPVRVMPVETAVNTPDPFQYMDTLQLEYLPEAAFPPYQSKFTGQIAQSQHCHGPQPITAPRNEIHEPQNPQQAQSRKLQQLPTAAAKKAMQQQEHGAFASQCMGTSTPQMYPDPHALDRLEGSPYTQENMYPDPSGHSLLLGSQDFQGMLRLAPIPPVFQNNPQFSNITAPPFPRPPYATSKAPNEPFYVDYVPPTSAQAALAQLRNRLGHHATPMEIGPSTGLPYAQHTLTAQQEIARNNALRSHAARLQGAFGGQISFPGQFDAPSPWQSNNKLGFNGGSEVQQR